MSPFCVAAVFLNVVLVFFEVNVSFCFTPGKSPIVYTFYLFFAVQLNTGKWLTCYLKNIMTVTGADSLYEASLKLLQWIFLTVKLKCINKF